jgi:ssDNA-binding Zn-finger/Zn-ribbon topoisomerase 1
MENSKKPRCPQCGKVMKYNPAGKFYHCHGYQIIP